MMFNRTIRVTFVFVVIAIFGQAVYGNVDELAAESLSIHKQVETIQAEMDAATSKERKRIQEIESVLKELSPEIVLEYTRQIKQYEEQIESLKKRIADLERKIEEVRNTDPNELTAKAAKLDAEAKKLRTTEQEIAKPFKNKISELEQSVLDKKTAFNEVIKQFCMIPGEAYPEVAKNHSNVQFHRAFISYRWINTNGKQVAWAHLRLRDKPAISSGAKMLDDTYYIQSSSGNSIWVWAGHFNVCFVISKKEWQGKEKVAEAVKHFIDLKSLAKIDAIKETK